MEQATIAELQVLLEGVPLPYERSSLLKYALSEGATAEQMAMLRRLPGRRYDSIDEVAEELVPVQPAYERAEARSAHAESGAPPGGDAYTQPHPDSGQVRDLDA
jgi:hypothetical protein